MKLAPNRREEISSAAITQTLGIIAICSALFVLTAYAASPPDPAWWYSPGTGFQGAVVLPQVTNNNGVATTNYAPNNYAVVTQGQLKQFTARAVDELNLDMPGGAGTDLNATVNNWAQDYATHGYNANNIKPSDYIVMNAGQLKYIANKVWTRLVASGYTNAVPSWLQTASSDNVAANLGQLKTIFNFDLSTWHPSDSLVLLSVLSGEGQSGPAGQTLPQPFVVQAINASGQPVSGLGLVLTVMQPGNGGISSAANGSFGGSMNVSTDNAGQATIYMEPGSDGPLNEVSCVATVNGAQATVYLTALTSSATSSNPTPGGGTPPVTDPGPISLDAPVPTITPDDYTSADAAANGDSIGDLPANYLNYRNITISWPLINGAISYEVDRMDDTGIWTTIATTTGESATDRNLYSGIAYQYRVIAIAGAVRSEPGLTSYSVPLLEAIAWLLGDTWYEFSTADGWWPFIHPYDAIVGWDNFSGDAEVCDSYKFIFNPTKTANIYTWCEYYSVLTPDANGYGGYDYFPTVSKYNCSTLSRQSDAYSVPLYPTADDGWVSQQIRLYSGLAINGCQPGSSVGGALGSSQGPPPGGVIQQGGAAFSINLDNANIGIWFNWVAADGFGFNGLFLPKLTVTYSGSSSLQVWDPGGGENYSGAIVPSGMNWPEESYFTEATTSPPYYPNSICIIPNPATVHDGDSITITVAENWYCSTSKTFTYTYKSNINPPDLSIPIDEASGSRYRKIALNGLPMSDEKPQQSTESDQEKEESYIDALTLGLRHGTTDVYMPVSGSDFSVSARRDFRSQVWDDLNGLRPHEQPDLPFGMCWSSNLAPSIKFTHNSDPNSTTPDQAIVTDEAGAVHTFFRWYDVNGNQQFFPMPTAKNEAQVPNLESLAVNNSTNPVTYIFTRKYGAVLTYQMTALSQTIDNDRLVGPSYSTTYQYARLIQAVDRVGNTINYQFQGATNLIPETITVANQPGIQLSIQQTPISGLSYLNINNPQSVITAIWDANGNKTSYTYASAPSDPTTGAISDSKAVVLSSVTTPDGAITQYSYDATQEGDLTPPVPNPPTNWYHYVDIGSITDPLGHAYNFTYALDHSKLNYMNNPQGYTGYYTQSGCLRNIAAVTMPDNTAGNLNVATFVNTNNPYLSNTYSAICLKKNTGGSGLVVSGPRINTVTDATGFHRTYTFDNSTVIPLPSFPQPNNSITQSKIIAYQSLNIAYGNLGSETFQFDINAAMALKQITDFSGNVTTFAHTDAWIAPPTYTARISGATLNGYYDDPTNQTDALTHTKTFAYDPSTRIMTDSVDENGNHTHNDIDSLGRRTSEKIYDPNGKEIQETDFAYGNTAYPGFMTQKTVQALGGADPSWVQSLVTQYSPDANGRVAQEIVDPNGLNLVTTFSYDSNGNKLTATDPRGNTTWFNYDSRNRLVTITNADGSQKQRVYDARGNKIKEYDENGIATLYQYDALNRLTAQARDMNGNGVIDPTADLVTSYTYNNANSKLTTIAPAGGVTKMFYDNLQRVTDIYTSPGNSVQYDTHFDYDPHFNCGGNCFDGSSFKPTHIVDPRGFTTDITYDALYHPLTKAVRYDTSKPASNTSTQYDAVGNPVLVTDPLGHQTGTTYDALNRPLVVTYADASTTHASYTSTGFKWQVIDQNANNTQTAYDNAGRAISITAGYGTSAAATATTAYDAAGNVAETVNPLHKAWNYIYDARNRKVQEFEPTVADASNGNQTSRPILTWRYDSAGRVTATIDARNNETDTYYDAANRVTDVKAPPVPVTGGGTQRPNTHTYYDKNGNVVDLWDPNHHKTHNTYDLLNHLLTTKDAADITVTNTYDQVGNKVTVQDGNLNTTTFAYDGLNRNTSVTDAAGRSTTFTYDALNKTQRTDAIGQVTTYLYDNRNRLQHVIYTSSAAANSQRNFAYDGVGNLLSVAEPAKNGVADVAYTYDPLNRTLTETVAGAGPGAGAVTHTYTYDAAGNRLQTVYGGTGRTITSTFDALNHLSTMTESGRTTSYAYDLNGNIAQKTAPNGDTETYSYDALNRATQEIASAGPGGGQVPLFNYQYGYDLASNVLTVAETYPSGLNNRTVSNTYDAINRLLTEAITGAAPNVTTTYTYDNANNRATKEVAVAGSATVTTNYQYNNLNQLTGFTDTGDSRSVAYVYDNNGNRTSRTVTGGSDSGTDTYSYDFENRLIGLVKGTNGGGGTYAYTYDYRTRRIVRDESQAGSVVTTLVFSGGTSVQEYTGANLLVEYIRGSDYGGGVGGILYTLRGGHERYTHANKRGDVIAKTDSNGNLKYQAQYEAFGNQVATNGTTEDRQKSNSKDTDPTGLVDEGIRYRDLETGMFISRDPAGFVDGPNLYTYVRQNPWTSFDPEGLATFVEDAERGAYNLFHQSLGQSATVLAQSMGLDRAAVGAQRLATGQWGAMGQSLSQIPGQVKTAISQDAHLAAAGTQRLASGNFSATDMEDSLGRGCMTGILAFGCLGPDSAALKVENSARDVVESTEEGMAPQLAPQAPASDPNSKLFPNLRNDNWVTPIKIHPTEDLTKPTFGEGYDNPLIFVVTKDGRLVVGDMDEGESTGGHHNDLAQGEPVQAAGMVIIYNGKLLEINNFSGHYKPSGPSAMAAAIKAFQQAGFKSAKKAYKEYNQEESP